MSKTLIILLVAGVILYFYFKSKATAAGSTIPTSSGNLPVTSGGGTGNTPAGSTPAGSSGYPSGASLS